MKNPKRMEYQIQFSLTHPVLCKKIGINFIYAYLIPGSTVR